MAGNASDQLADSADQVSHVDPSPSEKRPVMRAFVAPIPTRFSFRPVAGFEENTLAHPTTGLGNSRIW